MQKLLEYINSLAKDQRTIFCQRIGTTERYLRKAISKGHEFGPSLCINIERATGGLVVCEDLVPTVDWAYLRATAAAEVPSQEAR